MVFNFAERALQSSFSFIDFQSVFSAQREEGKETAAPLGDLASLLKVNDNRITEL